ncbi:hypothetical protein HK16_02185 [Acetobacter senegalensis]|uniref:Uncharacterized protein n=1 Tax=Acetobacter senegalensis TaxID=446692 RepID=A0A252ELZ4_9PROT|nr:hypothetical protein HK16_02185 [Acetobacter senegalensis]
MGHYLDHINSSKVVFLGVVRLSISDALIEGEVFSHGFIGKELDVTETSLGGGVFRKLQQSSPYTQSLRNGSDRHVVKQHGICLRDQDKDAVNRFIMKGNVNAPAVDQGSIIVQHRPRFTANAKDVVTIGMSPDDGLDSGKVFGRGEADFMCLNL